MELRYLKYFLAVAETGNFTRAAARCLVAQSALSEQIARLETEVGMPLFARTSRAVRLTAAGEVLVPLAQRILADVDMAQAELDALASPFLTAEATGQDIIDPAQTRELLIEFVNDAQRVLTTQVGIPGMPYRP